MGWIVYGWTSEVIGLVGGLFYEVLGGKCVIGTGRVIVWEGRQNL